MQVWLDCLLHNCGTSWLQHGLDWQHFQVGVVDGGDIGLESNCFGARSGGGVEHVVSGAANAQWEHMLLMLLMLMVAAQVSAWLLINVARRIPLGASSGMQAKCASEWHATWS